MFFSLLQVKLTLMETDIKLKNPDGRKYTLIKSGEELVGIRRTRGER